MTQSGSVWNSVKISLNNPFDFWFNVFLGCGDSGADGMVFMLQPISTSVGSTGEGMGFLGVSPSIGIALDTYQNLNLNDPTYDHISIQANGVVNHSSDLAGPVAISATNDNVEDCQWHKLRISWDPLNKWLRAYFDGVLRVEKQVDLVGTIFNNDPNVYWGFSGATGGEVNLQQFCTALDPYFITNFPNDAACTPATLQFTDRSESFAPIDNYSWDFGDGTKSNVANPPPHVYTSPGEYKVSLSIKGLDGCENDTVRSVKIGAIPDGTVKVFDTCFKRIPQLSYSAPAFGVNYQWRLDGSATTTQTPVLSGLSAGSHTLELIAASDYNCGPPHIATSQFMIKPTPQVAMTISQLCETINFSGNQTDGATTIDQWSWSFGDNQQSNLQNPVHRFGQSKQYPVQLWAAATNGCLSDTITKTIDIPVATAFAGNDTVVVPNLPFQLHAAGNGSFHWSPASGLSNPDIAAPTLLLSADQTYVLIVTTTEGCVATDTIHLKAIEGPAIYVPSGFTPNGDRLNDILRPVYVGIKELESFTIYNRWGQMVFNTKDMSKGWDGSVHQKPAGSETYVWMIHAKNYLDQSIQLKGTVTIIR